MRTEAQNNPLLNTALIVCAEIVRNNLIYNTSDQWLLEYCNKIPSPIISHFLEEALQLMLQAYDSAYIDVMIQYEYEKLDRSRINNDELKVLVILRNIVTRVFQQQDLDFFYQFYSQECPADVRNHILQLLQG